MKAHERSCVTAAHFFPAIGSECYGTGYYLRTCKDTAWLPTLRWTSSVHMVHMGDWQHLAQPGKSKLKASEGHQGSATGCRRPSCKNYTSLPLRAERGGICKGKVDAMSTGRHVTVSHPLACNGRKVQAQQLRCPNDADACCVALQGGKMRRLVRKLQISVSEASPSPRMSRGSDDTLRIG